MYSAKPAKKPIPRFVKREIAPTVTAMITSYFLPSVSINFLSSSTAKKSVTPIIDKGKALKIVETDSAQKVEFCTKTLQK